jgi:hypothetical protein
VRIMVDHFRLRENVLSKNYDNIDPTCRQPGPRRDHASFQNVPPIRLPFCGVDSVRAGRHPARRARWRTRRRQHAVVPGTWAASRCGRGRARREVVRSQLRLLSRGKGARRRRAQSGPLRGGAARREGRFRMGAMMSNGPSTYMPNGSQYLLVGAGDTLFAFKLAGERK